jgi:hypothetical protein
MAGKTTHFVDATDAIEVLNLAAKLVVMVNFPQKLRQAQSDA